MARLLSISGPLTPMRFLSPMKMSDGYSNLSATPPAAHFLPSGFLAPAPPLPLSWAWRRRQRSPRHCQGRRRIDVLIALTFPFFSSSSFVTHARPTPLHRRSILSPYSIENFFHPAAAVSSSPVSCCCCNQLGRAPLFPRKTNGTFFSPPSRSCFLFIPQIES